MSKRSPRVESFALLACIALAAMQANAQGAPRTPLDYLHAIDADGDGRVSRSEYIAWMDRGFEHIDADGNGVLEGDELPPGAR